MVTADRKADARADALRLVRLRSGGSDLAGVGVYEDLLPAVVCSLAAIAAGLLADLARATGSTPEALLDRLEFDALTADL